MNPLLGFARYPECNAARKWCISGTLKKGSPNDYLFTVNKIGKCLITTAQIHLPGCQLNVDGLRRFKLIQMIKRDNEKLSEKKGAYVSRTWRMYYSKILFYNRIIQVYIYYSFNFFASWNIIFTRWSQNFFFLRVVEWWEKNYFRV